LAGCRRCRSPGRSPRRPSRPSSGRRRRQRPCWPPSRTGYRSTRRQPRRRRLSPSPVLVMGRRNIDVSDPPLGGGGGAGLDRRRLKRGVEVESRTIHAAKGTEADYAVLIDSGMPSWATAPAQARARPRLRGRDWRRRDLVAGGGVPAGTDGTPDDRSRGEVQRPRVIRT